PENRVDLSWPQIKVHLVDGMNAAINLAARHDPQDGFNFAASHFHLQRLQLVFWLFCHALWTRPARNHDRQRRTSRHETFPSCDYESSRWPDRWRRAAPPDHRNGVAPTAFEYQVF